MLIRHAVQVTLDLRVAAEARHGLVLLDQDLFGLDLVVKSREFFCGQIRHCSLRFIRFGPPALVCPILRAINRRRAVHDPENHPVSSVDGLRGTEAENGHGGEGSAPIQGHRQKDGLPFPPGQDSLPAQGAAQLLQSRVPEQVLRAAFLLPALLPFLGQPAAVDAFQPHVSQRRGRKAPLQAKAAAGGSHHPQGHEPSPALRHQAEDPSPPAAAQSTNETGNIYLNAIVGSASNPIPAGKKFLFNAVYIAKHQ